MTKILLSTALAVSLAVCNAVLPPGYEDEMWCPSEDCKVYSNPFGLSSGPSSSFYYCFNNSTGNVTDGVWTGNFTNVTAPEDWEEPEECTSEEYSECEYDEDCIVTVRTAGPTDEAWGLCTCFADSIYHPFDQCEGRNETYCADGWCEGDPCRNYYGECVKQENGAGACIISFWTERPTRRPTRRPTMRPSKKPSRKPSKKPTKKPSNKDTDIPTAILTEFPTPSPFEVSSEMPSSSPTAASTVSPTLDPITAAPSIEIVTPVPTFEDETESPVHMSLPMEDMFDEKKKRVFVGGSKTPPNSNNEYYDGGVIEKEQSEFGRYSDVQAIA